MAMPPGLPQDPEQLTRQLHAWLDKWREPIDKWLTLHQAEQPDFARFIQHLPSLMQLTVNLIKDPYIGTDTKLALYQALVYVMNEDDAIPEAELGAVGLVDDSIQVVDQLNEMVGRYSPMLVNNWSGEGDILAIIEFIHANRGLYVKGD